MTLAAYYFDYLWACGVAGANADAGAVLLVFGTRDGFGSVAWLGVVPLAAAFALCAVYGRRWLKS